MPLNQDNVSMSEKHGAMLRGLTTVPNSQSLQGRFGRIFHLLPPAQVGSGESENTDNLRNLGALADHQSAV